MSALVDYVVTNAEKGKVDERARGYLVTTFVGDARGHPLPALVGTNVAVVASDLVEDGLQFDE